MESSREMEMRHRREKEALDAEERATARAGMYQQRLDAAAAETAQNEANLDARVRALSPASLLAELAREGKSIRLLDDGTIALAPPGLNIIQQRVLENRRDDVAGLLRERQRVQII